MTAKSATSHPMRLLAQLDNVAVFQTRALTDKQKTSPVGRAGLASYGDFNVGLHVNDDPLQVLNHRMQLLRAINDQLQEHRLAAIERLHWVNQVHGNDVHDIDKTTIDMQPVAADAMVSCQSGIGLAIMTADCVPIVLYQPASGQIAAIHAGWQGLASGVIRTTAERFETAGQIIAWMGVCISQAHYEVGASVKSKLLAGCADHKLLDDLHLNDFDRLYSIASDDHSSFGFNTHKKTQVTPQYLHKRLDKLSNCATVNADKVKLNLPRLAADQLAACGITLDTHLPVDCSYADARYYSYRRQTHLKEPATGRMALVIVRSYPL